jgi:BatD DUF11 like domain
MKKPIFLFILLMTVAGASLSQNIPVSATVDKQKILIGEQIQLYLKAVVKNGRGSNWFVVDSFPHFEILQRSKIDSQQTSEGLFLQQTITLTSWDSGRWAIPPFGFANLKTKPLVIDVTYSPMDPNQPYHDIKDIIEVQKPISSNWYWYLVGIAVLIALFLLFFPPKEEKTIAPLPVPVEDPYKTAIARLEKLNTGEESKYFFTELINIFRDYLEKRKNIQSFSKTTDDLSIQMRQLQLPHDQYIQLVQALQLSDMVKFAKFQPTAKDKEESIQVITKNIMAIENLN